MAKLSGLMWNYHLTAFSIITSMALLFFTDSALAGSPNLSLKQNNYGYSNYTDQLIIKYKDISLVRSAATGNSQASSAISDRLNRLNSANGTRLTHHRFMSGNGQVVKLPSLSPLAEAEAIAASLRSDPDIAYAEPDRRMRPMLTPNDPRYVNQWHYAVPASFAGGANLPGAWDLTTGSNSIVIAVIDTGILTHADLAGRTVAGYNFISDAFTAGNGTGRSSDPTDLGDWVAAGACGTGAPAEDSSWHGTHVAGTIGAASNNGIGVTGINWVSHILPVRVLGKCGGFTSDIADGMRWAAGLTVSGVPANANPAKVMNLSLGGNGSCGTTFQNAINDVIASGATVVVAAGNDNSNVANSSPANCIGVISVAAVGPAGGRAYYSNTGSGVTIAAPGGDLHAGANKGVLSTLNSGLTTSDASPGGDIYAYYQGTSMATPHVAGIVSLMLSLKPSLTSSQITTLLQSSARNFPTNTAASGGDCTTALCGSGIIDAAAAVASTNNPIISTAAITSITSTSAVSGGTVTSDGGTTVSGRGVCWGTSSRPAIGGIGVTCVSNGTGTGVFTSSITGLTINSTYYLRAYAINSAGTTYGNEQIFFTSVNQFLPIVSTSIISAITTSSSAGGGNITSDGGADITARGVCWSTAANPTTSDTCSSDGIGTGIFSSSITGLTPAKTYHVRAYATNAIGTGYGIDQNFSTSADPPVITTKTPIFISNINASSGGNVTLGGGASVTARGVCWGQSINPLVGEAGSTCTIDGNGTGQFSSSITGLTSNTQYHVRAYATNSNNTTSYGADITFKTLAAATKPSVLTTIPISSITATSAKGGGNIISDGGATVSDRGLCWSTASNPSVSGTCLSSGNTTNKFSLTITGLNANTFYYVVAYASNSNGTSYGKNATFKTGTRPVKFILFPPK